MVSEANRLLLLICIIAVSCNGIRDRTTEDLKFPKKTTLTSETSSVNFNPNTCPQICECDFNDDSSFRTINCNVTQCKHHFLLVLKKIALIDNI